MHWSALCVCTAAVLCPTPDGDGPVLTSLLSPARLCTGWWGWGMGGRGETRLPGPRAESNEQVN